MSLGGKLALIHLVTLSREIHKHDRLSLYLLNGGGAVHDLEDCLAGDKTFPLCTVLTYWLLLGLNCNSK